MIEHQGEGEQHALGALLLRVTARRFGIARQQPLEVGVGQIVQGHRALQAEETAHLLEQKRLDARLVPQQQVGGPIQTHQRHALEIELEHLAECRLMLEPAPGGQLRGRGRHAGDDVGDGRRALRAIESQCLQRFDKADLAHHRQRGMLHPHRARRQHLQRVDVNFDKGASGLGGRRRAPRRHARLMPQQQLRCVVLGELLQCRGKWQQRRLTAPNLLDVSTQRWPVFRLDREMPSQIEQRDLANTLSGAFAAHQAVRDVGLASPLVMGANPSDVHASASIEQTFALFATPQKFYGTTSQLAEAPPKKTDTYLTLPGEWSGIMLKMG